MLTNPRIAGRLIIDSVTQGYVQRADQLVYVVNSEVNMSKSA